jgi:hypothetical protein
MRQLKGKPPFVTQATGVGAVITDPNGQIYAIPFPSGLGTPPTVAGNVTANANIGDNRIVRGDGGGVGIQESLPSVADDGRITDLTNPTAAQDAATKDYVDAAIAIAPSHSHGLMRDVGDGATTTFEFPDFAESIQLVAVNGLVVDPLLYTLSDDRTQIVFAVAPTAGHVIVILYLVAMLGG